MKKSAFNELLLYLATESIKEHFYTTTPLNKAELTKQYPQLNELRATFVTLTLNQQLRGCIGSLVARRSLYDDLISNAKAAAFSDPRFKPLSVDELSHIHVEISLLSQPNLLEYSSVEDLKSKIVAGDDGVIVQYKNFQATFLPQVWEQLPSFELFFEHLCAKAGVSVGCLEDNATIYTYKVEKIK
jgi:AmmeMemoRadiSam system protein A